MSVNGHLIPFFISYIIKHNVAFSTFVLCERLQQFRLTSSVAILFLKHNVQNNVNKQALFDKYAGIFTYEFIE